MGFLSLTTSLGVFKSYQNQNDFNFHISGACFTVYFRHFHFLSLVKRENLYGQCLPLFLFNKCFFIFYLLSGRNLVSYMFRLLREITLLKFTIASLALVRLIKLMENQETISSLVIYAKPFQNLPLNQSVQFSFNFLYLIFPFFNFDLNK